MLFLAGHFIIFRRSSDLLWPNHFFWTWLSNHGFMCYRVIECSVYHFLQKTTMMEILQDARFQWELRAFADTRFSGVRARMGTQVSNVRFVITPVIWILFVTFNGFFVIFEFFFTLVTICKSCKVSLSLLHIEKQVIRFLEIGWCCSCVVWFIRLISVTTVIEGGFPFDTKISNNHKMSHLSIFWKK